jgi:hypothetical protein
VGEVVVKGTFRFSFLSPYLSHVHASRVPSLQSSSLLAPFHAECLPHHPHNHHVIIIAGLAMSVSVHHYSSSPSRFYFLIIKAY